ncbi:hypothetical protein FB45DRAFT_1000253 [Roridomyces roridus]|uniref:Uncharacterized protein n=1 Tax=Roridomyces roridus TaxID=1738132 RepID=A0AAD7C7X8_9AGAR|nr:hypothetical protein FB45DRAFT_1000253 [Roridomyces roridus]
MSAQDHTILRFFSAPHLEAPGFAMPWNTQNSADIISFLQRSSPPLQTLVIEDSEKEFRVFNDIIPLVSTISRLEFEWLEIPFATDLFETLAQHPSSFLPNLDSLKFHSLHPFPPLLWRSLVRAALARRKQLRSMRVTFASTVHVRVPPDVLGSFRTLSMDSGMDIFIGKSGNITSLVSGPRQGLEVESATATHHCSVVSCGPFHTKARVAVRAQSRMKMGVSRRFEVAAYVVRTGDNGMAVTGIAESQEEQSHGSILFALLVNSLIEGVASSGVHGKEARWAANPPPENLPTDYTQVASAMAKIRNWVNMSEGAERENIRTVNQSLNTRSLVW